MNENDAGPGETERLYFHMDMLLHNRVYYSLVAQTIFVIASVTVWSQRAAVVIIAILGAVTTALFTFTNLKLYFRVHWLAQRRMNESQFFKDYIELANMDTGKFGCCSKAVIRLISGRQPRLLDTGWLFTWGLCVMSLVWWIALVITRFVT